MVPFESNFNDLVMGTNANVMFVNSGLFLTPAGLIESC